jgi:small subunit ribosomal protein S20
MASHKSAKKRIRTNARKRIVNKIAGSKIKTVVKKALSTSEKEEAEKLYKEAVAILDRGATKGKIPLNTASRKKAALTKHLNSLTTVAAK